MRKFFAIAGLLVFVQPLSAAELPKPEVETLKNGLTVVWFEEKRLPLVDMAILVQSGYRHDPRGKSGTASLLSNVLDRGAGGMSAEEFARAVERLGAKRYSSADEDTFTVGMHGLAEDAPALMDLMARQVLQPDFPEHEVKREHARMLDRWRHIGDHGSTLADLAYYRLMTAGSPYGRGSFLSAGEFVGVTREDIQAFHKKHFTPGNAVLMIVGKVDRESLRRKVLKTFGEWKGEKPELKVESYADDRLAAGSGPRILVVNRKGLTQAQVRIGFRAPLIGHPDHFQLVVANALLGEHFNSRLVAEIRDKLGLTYSIGSSFSYSKELAWFTIASSTRNEATGQLVEEVRKILGSMARGDVGEAEVTMAQEYLGGSFPLSVATVGAVASRWLGTYVFGLGPDYLNQFVPRVKKVNQAGVKTALKKHFDLKDLVVVIAGDGAAIAQSLKKSGLKFRQVTARELE